MFIPNNAPPPRPLSPQDFSWSGYDSPTPPPIVTLTAQQPFNPAHHLLWWSYPKLIWLSQNVPYYTSIFVQVWFWFWFWVCTTVLFTFFTWNLDTYLKNRFDPENVCPYSMLFFLLLLLLISWDNNPLRPNTRAQKAMEFVWEAIWAGSVLLAALAAGRDGIDLSKKRYHG